MKKTMNYVFFGVLISIIMPAIDAMHSYGNPRYLFLPVMYLLPLPQAIRQGNYKEVETFLKQQANQRKDVFLGFYLHLAVIHGHKDIAWLLIQKGARVNVQNFFGQTPLHRAVINSHEDIASILIQKGADVYFKDCFGRIPLDYALQHVPQQERKRVELLLNRKNEDFKKQVRLGSSKKISDHNGSRWQINWKSKV